MTMQVRGECLLLHQKQRDNRDRVESKVKRWVIDVSNQADFIFFSYGKQSLEVSCFYRRPFFFLAHPPLLLSRRSYAPNCIGRIISHQHILELYEVEHAVTNHQIFSPAGIKISNVAPLPESLVAVMMPLWFCTIFLTIASPIPVPGNCSLSCSRWNTSKI
jgi:hypothetical protein